MLEDSIAIGTRIGRAIARDVLAEDMPREWTGLDPQDADQIPEGMDHDAVARAAEVAYDAIIAKAEGRRYRVRLGGSPPDSGDVYDTAAEAEAAAVEMALEVAERDNEREQGSHDAYVRSRMASQDVIDRGPDLIDLDEIEIWGGEGDECGWGACHEDDDGAYYPHIEVED